MIDWTKSLTFSTNLSKSFIFSREYKLLFYTSRFFSFFVAPPKKEDDAEIVKHLKNEVIKLHQLDAENVARGIYPNEIPRLSEMKDHLFRLPNLVLDSLKVARRRKLKIHDDLTVDDDSIPDYLNRNYHFQTGGYFSQESAFLYEHQVEILFSGTARPMRRYLIKMIKEQLSKNSHKPLKILEIGAGVGSATIDFSKSFNFEQYTVLDISKDYLSVAKKRFSNLNMEFVHSSAENLPFKNEEFDLVFSVFLFHELPRSVRQKVIAEASRVLKKSGIFAIADSIQLDDEPVINKVLDNFPKDYHEPFYKDYTLWNVKESLLNEGLDTLAIEHKLLSKYWVAQKRD
jgi:ubiquinone/menaquinone biosynthesis C-methylase UbiE